MRNLPPPSAIETLACLRWRAAARQRRSHQGVLGLVGLEVAQMALRFGADDLDGTVHEDDLPHGRLALADGAATDDLVRLIREAGREPIERDTLYNVVRVPTLM